MAAATHSLDVLIQTILPIALLIDTITERGLKPRVSSHWAVP